MLFIKSLFVLCSAAVVLAQRHVHAGADAVASAALFFGDDTTETLDPLKVFQNPINHATATSSVLAFSANQVGFHPSQKSADSLVDALDEFVTKVSTFPGLYMTENIQKSVSLHNHSTLDEFEKAIVAALPQVPHIGKIAFKFSELVPLHLDQEEAEELKSWILSVVIIDKPRGDNNVRVQLSRLSLKIAYDSGRRTFFSDPTPTPGTYIPEQRASTVFADFTLNSGFLIANAPNLANMIPIVDVESAIVLLSSPLHKSKPDPEDLLLKWVNQQRILSV